MAQKRCSDEPMMILEWEMKLTQQRVRAVALELKALKKMFKELKAWQAKKRKQQTETLAPSRHGGSVESASTAKRDR